MLSKCLRRSTDLDLDLNLFKYAFNVFQNWETVPNFLSAVMVEGDEGSRLRMAN